MTTIPPFSLLSLVTTPNLIAGAFVLTSVCFVHSRVRWLLPIHLAIVLVVVASHPLTTYFGRDGSLLVVLAYFLTVLITRTSIRPQYKLLVTSSAISVLILELLLSAIMKSPEELFADLPDYDVLVGAYHEGGFLVPNFDGMVVGETGGVPWVTNRFGFRDRDEVEPTKPPGTSRILLIGDSFVSGFRTGQDDMIGQVLEDELRHATGDTNIEVLVVGAAHPGEYLKYLRTHGMRFDPDLIVIGLTIGNDISQSYGARSATLSEVEMFTVTVLPPDAFTTGFTMPLALRVHRSLKPWRSYRTLARRVLTDGIGAWERDVPFDVHVFGQNHSLGHFYAVEPIAVVEASYEDVFLDMREIDRLGSAKGVGVVTALFPQRFQVSEREWRGTVFQFALNEAAFDVELPNRRILEFCESAELTCFDTLPALRARADEGLYLPLGDMHWNAKGHRIAGQSVARYLLETSQLPLATGE